MVGLPTREPRSDADRARVQAECGTCPAEKEARQLARLLRGPGWDWVVREYQPPRTLAGRLLLVAEVYDPGSNELVGQITIRDPDGRRRAAG